MRTTFSPFILIFVISVTACLIVYFTEQGDSQEGKILEDYNYQIEKAYSDIEMFPERATTIMKSMNDLDSIIKIEYDSERDMDRKKYLVILHERIEVLGLIHHVDSLSKKYQVITSLP